MRLRARSVVDTTPEARADGAALAEHVARLEAALATAPDAVVVVDPDGELVLRNEAAARFSGARHGEAIAEEALRELLEQARLGHAGDREVHLFGPPREVLHIEARPLHDGGQRIGAVAYIRDVSEAHRIDTVRRDFVANVSHELRTPIGALTLLAETLAEGGDEPVMRSLAGQLVREAERLGHIVDDLLDLSLIEAQEARHHEPVPVALLVLEAVDRVRQSAELARIPLDVQANMPDVTLACDRRQIVSAITNLLDNAVKYSEPGGVVELRASAAEDTVTITVRDHGIGIPSKDLERVFERFYRVDRARSRATGGTGLGLAIVRHVAQAHGGDVTVESREGEGSTFRVRLPLAGAPAQGTDG